MTGAPVDRERAKPQMVGGWKPARLVDAEGNPVRGEAAIAYITECIRAGGDADFYFVWTQMDDGKNADVCHTGNGPNSKANAERIASLHAENIDLCHELAQWREKWHATLDTLSSTSSKLLAAEAEIERLRALASEPSVEPGTCGGGCSLPVGHAGGCFAAIAPPAQPSVESQPEDENWHLHHGTWCRSEHPPAAPPTESKGPLGHEFWKPRVRILDRCAHITDNVTADECGKPAAAHSEQSR